MAVIVTRLGQGRPLTNNEVDGNFLNLADGLQQLENASGQIAGLDAGKITTGTLDPARISALGVTQHEAALTITSSQISDLDTTSAAAVEEAVGEIRGATTAPGLRASGWVYVPGTFPKTRVDTDLSIYAAQGKVYPEVFAGHPIKAITADVVASTRARYSIYVSGNVTTETFPNRLFVSNIDAGVGGLMECTFDNAFYNAGNNDTALSYHSVQQWSVGQVPATIHPTPGEDSLLYFPEATTESLIPLSSLRAPLATLNMAGKKINNLAFAEDTTDVAPWGQILTRIYQVTDEVLGGTDITAVKSGTTVTLNADATLARLASPALTGTPTAPTQAAGNNTTRIATTAFVQTALTGIIDAAPGTLDTLNELAAALGDDPNFATTVTTSIGERMRKDANLSDVLNVVTARTNLGLGTMATQAANAVAITGGTLSNVAIDGGTF